MFESRLPRRNALSLGVSLALATPTIVVAQGSQTLEEVLVTATKRSASIQDVSVAVTAFSEEDLKRGGIDDISRLEHMVPGMKFGMSGNEVRLAMRGTRTNNVGTEAEQVIGIFEDGVYVPTTTQALGSYVDLARVEVLRGPQGTLYGRNTFGGTVNIHTNPPSLEETTGYITGLYGDYERTKVEGAVNLPLGDTAALRIAAMNDQHDGYIKNDVPGVADLRDKDLSYFRASLLWAPTDNFDATLRVAYMDQSNSGDAIWGYQQIGGYVDGQFREGHQYAPDSASDNFDEGPWDVRRDFESNADLETKNYTLTVNWDVGIGVIKFIGNSTDFEGEQNFDGDYSDGGDPNNSGFSGWASDQDTWSTELQLVSNSDGPVQWMVGAYYYEQESSWTWLEKVNGEFGIPHWDRVGKYTSDSTGYFGNATFAASDNVRVIAGYRYAEDSKQKKDQLDWSVWPPVPAPGSGEEDKWDDHLWKLGLEYDINDDSMAYIQASTGYRAGGINFIADNVPLSYDPETVTAYEIGYKSTWMDSTLVLNVSAYLNEFEDMQAQSFAVLNEVVSEFTESGGELDSAGLEVELDWIPSENWRVSGTLAYMDAEFGDYNISKINGMGDLGGRQDLNDPQSLLSLDGWSPALSPEWSASVQVSYDFVLTGGSMVTPIVQIAYSDEYYSFDVNVDGALQDSHAIVDGRLVWLSSDQSIEVQAYVLNVGDEEVLTRSVIFNPGAAPNVGSIQSSWNNPRTWGVSATYNF